MNQILHIFRKDTRRFWLEILLSVVVTAAYTLILPTQWKPDGDRVGFLVLALALLIPVTWWLLITRVVHAERQVGDDQFWITRPYEWKKLLAAKGLFLAVWIGLPFLASQFLQVAEAGLHPQSYLAAMMLNLLITCAIVILPLAAIAVVTSNFARMTLTLLAGFAAILLLAFGAMAIIAHQYSAFNPLADYVQSHVALPLEFFGCVIILLLQYATRRTWLARTLIVAFAIVLLGISVVYRSQLLIDSIYSQRSSASNPPIKAAVAGTSDLSINDTGGRHDVYIRLPMHYSDVPEGYAAVVDDFRFTMNGTDGSKWTSPWQQSGQRLAQRYLPGTAVSSSELVLKMSQDVYNRFRAGPVTLRITLAITRLQADKLTTVSYPTSETAVPGIGVCFSNRTRSFLDCRSVVRQTKLSYLSAAGTTGPCPDAQGSPANGVESGGAWMGELNPAADLPLNAILHSVYRIQDSAHHALRICDGSPLTITQYHLVDRTRMDVTVPSFILPVDTTHRDQ